MKVFIKVLLVAVVMMFVVTGINAAITSPNTVGSSDLIENSTPSTLSTNNSSGNVLSLGIVDTSPLSSLNYISPIADFYFTSLLYMPFVSSAFPPAPLVEPTSTYQAAGLAQGWTHNANYTVWVLNLKKDLKWDNGSPLNSTDLWFSLKEYVALGDVSFSCNVTNISIVNSTAVKITTNTPEPNLLYQWAIDEDGIIIPYQTYKNISPSNYTNITNFNNIVADGPYVFYNYTPGENPINFVPNKYYYEGMPHYKELSVRIFSDTTSMISAYKSGTLDAITDAGAYNSIYPLLSIPGYSVATLTPSNEMQVVFNMHAYPFGETNFRKGIAYLLNRSEINSRVNSANLSMPSYGDLLPGQAASIDLSSNSVMNYSYNFSKAESLFNSVGIIYSGGKWLYKNNDTQVSFTIDTTSYGTGNVESATLVSDELNAAGFSTTVSVETYSTYSATQTFSSTGWQLDVSESLYGVNPNALGQMLVAEEQDNSTFGDYPAFNGTLGWNYTYFNDLIDSADSLPTGSSLAIPYLQNATRYVANMVPFIPIYIIYNYAGYSKSIYFGNPSNHTGLFNPQNEVPNDFWYGALYDATPIASVSHAPINYTYYIVIGVVIAAVIVGGVVAAVMRGKKKAK